MTIIQVNEIWQGRDGSGDASGEQQYSRVFRVRTNSNFDTAVEATNHPFIPVIGNLFPSDLTAFCQRVSASQETFSPRVWIITASYSNKREVTDNPISDPTEITWDTEQFQRPAFKDRSGNAIVNSAGDPFDPPADRDDSRITVRLSRNMAVVPDWILLVADKLNSSPVTIDGISVGTEKAKIQKVSIGKKESRNDTQFRNVTTTIHLQTDDWQLSVLDQGFREKISGTKRKNIINDEDFNPISSPALLDGSGNQLVDPKFSNAVFKDFDVYGTFDFNTLPY